MTSSSPPRDQVKPSDPIAINTSIRRGRGRSFSLSSGSSSSSDSSTSEAHTPSPTSVNSQRITVPSPSDSPILSYFLGQSPSKNPGTAFPFNRKFGHPPVFEGDCFHAYYPISSNPPHRRRARSPRYRARTTCQHCRCRAICPITAPSSPRPSYRERNCSPAKALSQQRSVCEGGSFCVSYVSKHHLTLFPALAERRTYDTTCSSPEFGCKPHLCSTAFLSRF